MRKHWESWIRPIAVPLIAAAIVGLLTAWATIQKTVDQVPVLYARISRVSDAQTSDHDCMIRNEEGISALNGKFDEFRTDYRADQAELKGDIKALLAK